MPPLLPTRPALLGYLLSVLLLGPLGAPVAEAGLEGDALKARKSRRAGHAAAVPVRVTRSRNDRW